MTMRFDDRVAIITGGGNGLGRSHALALAARGARVVVCDLKGADKVAAHITAKGGEAMAAAADVTDLAQMEKLVETVAARWDRVDILVNNAGILRDKAFLNMTQADFRAVLDVHVMGAFNASKAVWPRMREQNYGRIVMTSSSSGLYGNFGQANYGAAKMALIGLMNVLHLEGAKYDIRVNALAPVAYTAMTENLLPPEAEALLAPEAVSVGLLALVHERSPSRTILAAGAGGFARTLIHETQGIYLAPDARTPEAVMAALERISDPEGQRAFTQGPEQTMKFLGMAQPQPG